MESPIRRDYPDRPLFGVSAVVKRGSAVLLVKRGRPPLVGLWSLPGGLVEVGETIRQATAREIREETGIDASIGEQLETVEIIHRDEAGAVDRHFVLAVMAGEWVSGEPTPGDDAAEAIWVEPLKAASFTMTPDTARILNAMGQSG